MNTTRPATSVAPALVLDLADARSLKAVEIAATAGLWATCHLADGGKAYGIPSAADPAHYYLVNTARCTCPDFQRRQIACKHVLAVRLHCALVRAHQPRTRAPRTAGVAKAANPAKASPRRAGSVAVAA